VIAGLVEGQGGGGDEGEAALGDGVLRVAGLEEKDGDLGVLRGQAFHGEGIYDDRDVVRHRALRCDEVDHPRERGDPEAYVR
jgi:hypothetical protein